MTGAENWKLGHDWRLVRTHRRRDSTRQLSRVGVGGVYWALESIMTPRSRATSSTLIVVDWSGMSVMLIWLSCWLDPNHRTYVFVGFSFSLLDDIQSLMALTHAVNLWTASASSLTVVLIYIWLSSAYWWKRRPCWVITWLNSAVYKTSQNVSRQTDRQTPAML